MSAGLRFGRPGARSSMIVSNGFAVKISPFTTCRPSRLRIRRDRKFTPLRCISYAVFCLKKQKLQLARADQASQHAVALADPTRLRIHLHTLPGTVLPARAHEAVTTTRLC